MEWDEYNRCNECGEIWHEHWDENTFYTQCPNGCDDFDFDEISEEEFEKLRSERR